MEATPPCGTISITSLAVDAWASDTHDVVILAAHGLGVAGVTGADADNADGRAVEPNKGVDILGVDTDEGKEGRDGRVVCLANTNGRTVSDPQAVRESLVSLDANLLGAFAALERASRALAGGAGIEGGGGRNEGQSTEDEGGEAGGDHGDESE